MFKKLWAWHRPHCRHAPVPLYLPVYQFGNFLSLIGWVKTEGCRGSKVFTPPPPRELGKPWIVSGSPRSPFLCAYICTWVAFDVRRSNTVYYLASSAIMDPVPPNPLLLWLGCSGLQALLARKWDWVGLAFTHLARGVRGSGLYFSVYAFCFCLGGAKGPDSPGPVVPQ